MCVGECLLQLEGGSVFVSLFSLSTSSVFACSRTSLHADLFNSDSLCLACSRSGVLSSRLEYALLEAPGAALAFIHLLTLALSLRCAYALSALSAPALLLPVEDVARVFCSMVERGVEHASTV